MKRLRVARIPYLNSTPFFDALAGDRVELVDLHPRALGQAARQGKVDAGLMSVADSFRTSEFEPLADLGIASRGSVHSVLLFSQMPVTELDGKNLAITRQTSTSYRLLRLLLEEHYEVRVATFARRLRRADPSSDDGMLLIGDDALRRAARGGLLPGDPVYGQASFRLPDADPAEEPFPYVLDLSAAWEEWQDLPFVFARWMVRREVDDEARKALTSLLLGTLDSGLRRLREIAAERAERVGLTEKAAYAYLMNFTYRLGDAEKSAIDVFHRLLDASAWWEGARPLSISREQL